MNEENKITTKRILIYLAITFVLTCVFEIGVIRPLLYSANTTYAMLGQTILPAAMLMPALGTLLTRLITKEGFKNAYILPEKGKFKKTIKYYFIAWFGMAVLILFGAVVYFLIYQDNFDASMPIFKLALTSTGSVITDEMLLPMMMAQLATALFLGPIINCIFCFGEEWGWRGYLVPKLHEKMPILPTILISGIIWGLWHAPLTVMGHNYGTGYWGYPITGILAMCVFCIAVGAVFSFLSIKAHSVLPAVIAHGSINSFSSAAAYFTKDGGNPFVGPVLTGIIGGCGFIIMAVIVTILLMKDEKKQKETV